MLSIKSISDVITNSSSEVFCYINHSDKKILKEIEDLLGDVFGYRQEPELDVVISMGECNRRRHLVVEYPYWKRKVKKFYSEGIKALLESNERFKGYSIDFTNYSREIE